MYIGGKAFLTKLSHVDVNELPHLQKYATPQVHMKSYI